MTRADQAQTRLGRTDLTGRVAVVTGSSKGWGRGVAEALAASGASVVVNGFSRPVDVAEVEKAIRATGGTATGVVADVADPEGASHLIDEACRMYGTVDVLVNCAAVKRPNRLLDMTYQDWAAELDVATTGTFLCTQRVARRMIEQGRGGRIINMAGASGVRGAAGHANGAASKAGVIAATYSWAAELAEHNITVNACRGAVRTPGNEPERRQLREKLGLLDQPEATADRSFGFYEPYEAAELVLWLASPAAADVTGVYFGIDGPRLTVWARPQLFETLNAEDRWSADDIDARLRPVLEKLRSARIEPILLGGAEQLLKYGQHV